MKVEKIVQIQFGFYKDQQKKRKNENFSKKVLTNKKTYDIINISNEEKFDVRI